MSAVGSVGNAQSGQAMGVGSVGSGDVSQLTAEGLLLYCQTQLNSLGGEIDRMMEEQLANIARKDAISTVENAMKAYQPPNTLKQVEELEAAFDKAINSLPEGDPTRLELEAAKNKVFGELNAQTMVIAPPPKSKSFEWGKKDVPRTKIDILKAKLADGGICGMSKDQWSALVGDVGQLRQKLSDDVEINMIKMQSYIAKQGTAIQLTTNMMSQIERGASTIAQNIRQ
jgi:hypothetical protein